VKRRLALLGAAGLGLGLVSPAYAQLALNWADTPPPGDALTKRLEDNAAHMAKYDLADHPHTVAFDYVYPTDPHEYEALGGNGVLLVSTVAKDPKELPVKQVVLRFGAKDVVLQPVSSRQSTVPSASSLAMDIGVNREDAFFLVPGVLPGKAADLVVVFAVPGRQLKAGRLSPTLPDSLKIFVKPPLGQPETSTLKAVLAREYPGLIKP
jgi:hypothetical protein